MTMTNFLIIAASSYLLGSFNSAIVICFLTLHKDIRAYGSGNAGLTNAYRTMGAQKTVAVLLGDIVKTIIAVMIGGVLIGPIGKLIAGIFVILGHVFPVYFGFRGGKGVLAGATMLAMFDWRIFLIALALFLLSVGVTRWVSLGSILGAISFPITTWLYYQEIALTVIAAGMSLSVIFLHRANIKRLVNGTENRLSLGGKPQIQHGEESKK